MRHRRRGRHLGRTSSHRQALRRNLACALIEHERIQTTPQKAKEVRPFVERLVTLARKGGLAQFRRALALLDDKPKVRKLFKELGPRFAQRPGGYTRILRLADEKRRLGDNAEQAIIEFVERGAPKPEAAKEAEKPAPAKAETKT